MNIMEKEIWKNINGYKGLYSVSNLGRVKSNKTPDPALEQVLYTKKSDTILKLQNDKDGYKLVCLCINNKRKTRRVHQLVMQEFKSDSFKSDLVINHKDHNKANNKIDNLEWLTQHQNILHMYRGMKNKKNKFPNVTEIQGKYRARLTVNGDRLDLGLYETPEEAFNVVKREAKKNQIQFD